MVVPSSRTKLLSDKSRTEDIASYDRYGIKRRSGVRRAVLCEEFLDLVAACRKIFRFRRTGRMAGRCSSSLSIRLAGWSESTYKLACRRRASTRLALSSSVMKREIRTNAIGKSKTPVESCRQWTRPGSRERPDALWRPRACQSAGAR